MNTKKCLYF